MTESYSIEWTTKGNTESCLHHAKEVAACGTPNKPAARPLVLLGARFRKYNDDSNEPQGTLDIVALQMVDIFKGHDSHISATEPLSLGQLRNDEEIPFPRYVRKQEDSHQDQIGKPTVVFHNLKIRY